jgi:hypothetical protein
VSLDASLYYRGLFRYNPADREAMLDFQKRAQENHPWLTKAFDLADRWMEKKLKADIRGQNPILPASLARPILTKRPERLQEPVGAEV